MKSYILRFSGATVALFGVFLTNASGCALESAPTVDDPGLETETACGPCALGYTAVPINGGCNPYACSCNGDWAVACGTQGGACTSCSLGETCGAAGACIDSCLRQGHEAGSACISGGYPGKWGASANGCTCCTGCFDPHTGLCQGGGANTACGVGGEWCDACSAGTSCSIAFIVGECLPTCTVNADCAAYASPCRPSLCQAGHCITGNSSPGTACPGGQCDGNGNCI